jgi:hypothetical protein
MANFVAGTTLAAADLNAALENYQPVNAQTGTTYTLAITDAGGLVTASNASAAIYTVPPNSSVAFAAGVHVDILNIGAGRVTLAPGSGVTVNGCTVVPPDARVHLIKQGTNTWYSQLVPHTAPVLLATASPSAASSVTFDGVFTSAFALYRVEWSLVAASGTPTVGYRSRLAGVDDTTANYAYSLVIDNPTAPASALTTGQTSMLVGLSSTSRGWATLDILDPAAASQTMIRTRYHTGGASPVQGWYAGGHNVATAYDGFSLTPTSSTVTGSVLVYGIPTAF